MQAEKAFIGSIAWKNNPLSSPPCKSSLSEKEKIIQSTVKSMQEANELNNDLTERLNKSKGMAGKHVLQVKTNQDELQASTSIYNSPNISFLRSTTHLEESKKHLHEKNTTALDQTTSELKAKAKQQLLETQEAFKGKVKRVSKPLVNDLTLILIPLLMLLLRGRNWLIGTEQTCRS